MKETLTILHTNDLHGHYDLALRQSAYIKNRKQELKGKNQHVIAVDGGDHLDMSMNECLATGGYIHLDMLASTGYDALSVGNNELLRLPKEKIRQLSIDSNVPWLLLNLEEADGSQIGGTRKTIMLEVGQLKIGMFGATDLFEDIYENKHGFRNRNTVTVIKEAVSELREAGANLIIFLSHMGNKVDVELAKELSGLIDVIVGAHSHTVLQKPEVVSDVVIVQAGCYGQYVGELQITVDLENKKVIDYHGRLIEMTLDDQIDSELEIVLKKGRLQAEKFLSEVIYHTEEDLSHEQIVRLAAASLKEHWNSEIGIMYGGGVTEGLGKGNITKGSVVNVCKSMHSPVIMQITGQQLTGLISESYNDDIVNRPIYGGGFRPHGIPIGKLQFSGVSWDGQGEHITNILVNGEEIDFLNTYTVGTGTPMLYEDISGYQNVKGNKLIEVGKDIMVKDVLINYMKKQYLNSQTMV
ncbi:bifunctional UDP-sugar hydrolase/5'-nucleotidase [Fictibacillus sp. UD]|uniref:bifunctional metallophosphatase/5'-nucleotidase n=1 Tax=Fictibacillus sp. UD TaxID=3038777 RepID=UPI0037466631